MSLDLDPNHIFRDFVIDGMPASGANDPRKVEVRQLLTGIWQAVIALVADAGPGLALPNLLIRYTVTGGAANVILATPNLTPPAGPGLALFSIQITSGNTGPVTINGKPLLTNGGQPLAAGDVKAADLLLFLDAGSNFRLVNDPASWRNRAAAELAQVLSETAQVMALAAQSAAEDAAVRALAIADNYEDLQDAVAQAESDADRSEAARDIAVGTVADFVGQGVVPIRNSLASAAAAPVKDGIDKLIVLGENGGTYVAAGTGSPDFTTPAGDEATAKSWWREKDVSLARVSEQALKPFAASTQNLYRKRIMANHPYFFEGYADVLAAAQALAPATTYLYPQVFTVDEATDQLFVCFNGDSGAGVYFIAAFQLSPSWKTEPWGIEYLGFFRAGTSMTDSLQILWEDGSRYIYSYSGVGIQSKYNITILPANGTDLLPVWERDTKSNAFSFRNGVWALWQRAYPMGNVYMRSVLEFTDASFNPFSVIDMGLSSCGFGSNNQTPMAPHISKRQGQVLGDGVIIQSHGGFWREGPVTPFQHTGLVIFGYDGQALHRALIDPFLMKPILETRIPIGHIENEGVYVTEEGYVFTLYVTQSRHNTEAISMGLTFFKEMDTTDDALDFSSAAVVSPLYDREKFAVGHFPRSGDNKLHNPHTGEAFDTFEQLADWMIAVAHPRVSYYTTIVTLVDLKNETLPSARWVEVTNRNNVTIDIRVYNAGFLERTFYLSGGTGSWNQGPTVYHENFAAPITSVITGGEITLAGYSMQIDTEGALPTDELTRINGGYAGARLRLKIASTSRKVTVKHNSGNIICGSDVVLVSANSVIELWCPNGGNWVMTNFAPNV